MEESSTSSLKSAGGTPRSSVDHSSSHNRGLLFRLRQGSSAGVQETSSPPTAPILKTARDDAVRSAKRFLLNTIRDDWQFPMPEDEDGQENFSRPPVDYTQRTEGASDNDDDYDTVNNTKHDSNMRKHDPYKFDSPDSVGSSIAERKRQRRERLKQEITWNHGLRHWIEQRDAWTQAVPKRPSGVTHSLRAVKALKSADSSSNRPVSGSSRNSTAPSYPSSSKDSIDSPGLPLDVRDDEPWLPIFPPLLSPDNPVRASIKPAAYEHIYSKVVVQSLTPSLPIPLTDMTNALVEGWKADGAWPPQSAVTPTTIPEVSKKRNIILNAARLKRIQGHGLHRRNISKEEQQGSVKKGIGTVKKALGLKHENGDFGIDFEEVETERESSLNCELNKGLLNGNH